MAWYADANPFQITVNAAASPPTDIDAGPPYSGDANTPIAITGTFTPGSDPNPTTTWTIDAGPAGPGAGGSFANASSPTTTFTPTVAGVFTLRFTVDADDWSPLSDTAQLTANVVDTPVTVENVLQAQIVDVVNLVQEGFIDIDGLLQAQLLDSVNIVSEGFLDVDELLQQQLLDTVDIVQAAVIAVNDLQQAQLVDVVDIAYKANLDVADIAHQHTLENIDLGTVVFSIVVNGVVQSQRAENAVLVPEGVMGVNGIEQLQQVDSILLTQTGALTVRDLLQQQRIDPATFGGLVVGSLDGEVVVYTLLQAEPIVYH